MNKPALVAIFAHPDDEAFGPSGTLHKYSKTHNVYLICATRGEAGENAFDDSTASVGELRERELRNSAKIIGIKEVYFLDYEDGTLCNNKYHDIAKKIRSITDKLEPEIFLTFEPQGVSGHLDHIAISMITHYIFYRADYVRKLMLTTIPSERAATMTEYFVYFPPGYPRDQIDEVVDVSDVWDIKLEAMKQHKTQFKDMSRILESIKDLPKEDYFLVKKK